jgi:hypothetical protein
MLRRGNIVLLAVAFLDVAKFTALTPLSLLISCKLSFQIFRFVNGLFTYIGIQISYQSFLMVFTEFIEYTFQFLVDAVLHIINCILCWGMNVQNDGIT